MFDMEKFILKINKFVYKVIGQGQDASGHGVLFQMHIYIWKIKKKISKINSKESTWFKYINFCEFKIIFLWYFYDIIFFQQNNFHGVVVRHFGFMLPGFSCFFCSHTTRIIDIDLNVQRVENQPAIE